ncbi:MAG: VCBS repeat-containing protein, partial [Proteobacteria bacterium]|nr:VCBS repeat-containing protein [Pseudomonadota bacterium]
MISWLTIAVATGAAPFGPPQTITTNQGPHVGLHLADVDHDGNLDVLPASASKIDKVSHWYENDGSGTSWTEHSSPLAAARSTADVDRDGDLDFLTTLPSHVFWEENGNNWATATIANTEAISIKPADIDGDGDIDAFGSGMDELLWWENDGNGTSWTEHQVAGSLSSVFDMSAADMDHDGDIDLIHTDMGTDTVSWWENDDGLGGSWTEHNVSVNFAGANDAEAMDLDFDGDLDIVGAAFYGGGVAWWENTGASFTSHDIDPANTSAYPSKPVDLDFDGDLDIVSADAMDGTVLWYENQGDSFGWNTNPVGSMVFPYDVEVGDLDGDGDIDFCAASGDVSGDVLWWANQSIHRQIAFETPQEVMPFTATANHLQLIDLSGDGVVDIIGVDDDELWWFASDPQGWVHDSLSNPGGAAFDIGDIDRDGDLDIVMAQVAPDKGVVWFSNEGTWFSFQNIDITKLADAKDICLVDADGDGDLDVAATDGGTEGLYLWTNTNGAGTSWSRSLVTTDPDLQALTAGDVDH